jgi:hypothetical protein
MAEATWGQLMQNAKGQLEPVPEGEHNVKIVDAEATKASTGSLMFKVKAEITEGASVKRRLFGNLVVSEENPMALAIFFRNMEAIGLNANFFAADPTPDQVASAMMNRTARVTVKHRVWQGVTRGDIAGWMPPLGGGLSGGPVAPGTVTGPAIHGPSMGATPPLPTASTPPNPTATPANTASFTNGPAGLVGPPELPI